MELGRPTPPKSTTKLSQVVRRTNNKAKNDAKYKVSSILKEPFV
jgi:hypothetical protein